MIITQEAPFSEEQVEKLAEEFSGYIKTVIDIDKKVCSAGANRHYESEAILLESGSLRENVWGGGIDLGPEIPATRY